MNLKRRNSQNNPTNIMHNSNRRNSTASDPGRSSVDVVGTTNWRTNRTKNTTLKNIRNRIKAKNTAALTRFLNQKPKPSTVLPPINIPKMAKPSIFQTAKNWYNSTKFSFQKKQQEAAGMKLLTEESSPKTNKLHPSYNDNKKNYDPNLNSINAEYTPRSPSTRPGAGFVY
jgi:hypothetical protein